MLSALLSHLTEGDKSNNREQLGVVFNRPGQEMLGSIKTAPCVLLQANEKGCLITVHFTRLSLFSVLKGSLMLLHNMLGLTP